MAVNKVVDRNGSTLIDLTNDTVKPDKVLAGVKFHGADGKEYTGSLPANKLDTLKYKFIDYDGTLMYSYTDEELDALTELPAGPDHTDDNLTFQGWNWTLEELKAVNRTRPSRPIVGACLITTDGKTYITLKTSVKNRAETFAFGKFDKNNDGWYSGDEVINIDWGDGSTGTLTIPSNSSYKTISHTFPSGDTEYTVVITTESNIVTLGVFNSHSIGQNSSFYGEGVSDIKIGNLAGIGRESKIYSSPITKINVPISTELYKPLNYCPNLKGLVVPKISPIAGSTRDTIYACFGLEILALPSVIEDRATNGTDLFYNFLRSASSLKYIYFPDTIITPKADMKEITFYYIYAMENLDLSSFNCPYVGINYAYGLKSVTLGRFQTINFDYIYCLSSIDIPDSVTTIRKLAIPALTYVKLPDSVTTINSYAFNHSDLQHFTLDLSEQTKVIPLTGTILGSPGELRTKILVPSALLDSYKSASYWSNYADYMVGV